MNLLIPQWLERLGAQELAGSEAALVRNFVLDAICVLLKLRIIPLEGGHRGRELADIVNTPQEQPVRVLPEKRTLGIRTIEQIR